EDGIRDPLVTGVQTCALPIWGLEVRGNHCVPIGFGKLLRGSANVDAGVVDQDINRAENAAYFVCEALDLGRIRNVHHKRPGSTRSEERRVGTEEKTQGVVGDA